MEKFHCFLTQNSIVGFVVLTFVISTVSFVLMFMVPGAQTPESKSGLPVWLIAIWSPNIAVVIIWLAKKNLIEKIQLAFSIPPFSWWMLLAFIPFLIAAIILISENIKGNVIEWSNFKMSYILPLLLINLFMGPLGEELGWRAFLYPSLTTKYGWMAGALVVGAIWAIWHAPLWAIDSPQSKIPFWAFFLNVVFLSMLMGMIYNHSQGSIIAVVLLHLTFNVSLGVIDILDSHQPGEFVIKSLYFYVPTVLILSGIHEVITTNKCTFEVS
ncbi:MAG: CPBP family intramembrane metalloprotease [Calditrichaeota bacterium]|nr:MAG: CPBP family intramembrane metalloprotease [Calditrichota bacterium]